MIAQSLRLLSLEAALRKEWRAISALAAEIQKLPANAVLDGQAVKSIIEKALEEEF